MLNFFEAAGASVLPPLLAAARFFSSFGMLFTTESIKEQKNLKNS